MGSDPIFSSWRKRINRGLDQLASFGAARSSRAWFSCIFLGSLLGIASAALAAWAIGYSPWIAGGSCLGAGLSCLAVAMARKVWTGEESYSFHTYFVIVAASSILILMVVADPVPAYLDFIFLALAMAHAFGRIGCLLVGCCHGKPHAWGISYGMDHVRAGFPRCYAGIRLFPIQVVESITGVLLTCGIVTLLLLDSPPGAAASMYVLGYAGARFFIEFFRGDFGRAQYADLSEAQWMSMLFIAAIGLGAAAGVLPIGAGMGGAALLAVLVSYALIRTGGRATRRRLDGADHLLELAEAVENVFHDDSPPGGVRVSQTSMGIRVSGGRVASDEWNGFHIAISRADEIMNDEIAVRVASRILRLRTQTPDHFLLGGRQAGVYHLLVANDHQTRAEAVRPGAGTAPVSDPHGK